MAWMSDNKQQVTILLIADTHLGEDYPFRSSRTELHRGEDFFRNMKAALASIDEYNVDFVVHGGDLFYRSRFPARLVNMALEPFMSIAEAGVPVLIVPGNHERSLIPRTLFDQHPNLYFFDEPSTFQFTCNNQSVAFSGFPSVRDNISTLFDEKVKATSCYSIQPDLHFLCIHQSVEGAQVGVQNYTFRSGPDVVSVHQLPSLFTAVLSGHIHRAQIITHDKHGYPIPSPVIYPGSIDRVSFAERTENKGYYILRFSRIDGGRYERTARFYNLPARGMFRLEMTASTCDSYFLQELDSTINALPPGSIVRLICKEELIKRGFSLSYCRAMWPQYLFEIHNIQA